MIIDDYKRINGWLNVRVNPQENQSLYDFSEYTDGIKHTLSEADELYNQYINNQPERSKREDTITFKKYKPSWDGLDEKTIQKCLKEAYGNSDAVL